MIEIGIEKYILILTKGAGELYKLEKLFDTREEANELGKLMCLDRIQFKDFVVLKEQNNDTNKQTTNN